MKEKQRTLTEQASYVSKLSRQLRELRAKTAKLERELKKESVKLTEMGHQALAAKYEKTK